MRIKMKALVFVLLTSFLLGSTTVYAAEFALSDAFVTVNVGESYTIGVIGRDVTPYWTSWSINKAKVDQNGVVTGMEPGSAIISARVGLTTKTCKVTVMNPTIKLNKKSAVIYSGEGTSTSTIQLKATTKGAHKDILWESSNPKIATVDDNGKVTAVSAGTVEIIATANGESAVCEITVKENSISLDKDTMQLGTKGKGSSIKLSATVVGSKKKIIWTTSDKNIATIKGGKVTGKNTGTAIITAIANGVSANCTVNVIKDSVSIGSEKEIIFVNQSKKLKTNAGKKEIVNWSSSDEKVVTIDEKGNITGMKEGTAIITVSSNNSNDTCEIVVKNTKTRIGEDVIELKTKGAYKTHTLGLQTEGIKKAVKWKTSDKKIATVNAKGKITGKKTGTVEITAEANGVKDTMIVKVQDYTPTVKLNHQEYVLYTNKGNTVLLKAVVDGPVKKVTWESSEPKVATVNNGKVVALREGQTVITATANGITEDCVITVKESKVLPEITAATMSVGETLEFPVDIIGINQKATYKISNNKIISLKKGILTAKSIGNAEIEVVANGVTQHCLISVVENKCEHTYTEGKITKEATCSEEGISVSSCSICHEEKEGVIDKTSHVWVEESRIDAACTVHGTVKYVCSVCQDIKQEILEEKGHNYGEWNRITTPTDFTKGFDKKYCSVCNDEAVKVTYLTEELTPDTPDPEEPTPDTPDPEEPTPDTPDPEEPTPDTPDPEEPTPDTPDPEEPTPDTPDPEEPTPDTPDPEEPTPDTPDPEEPTPDTPDPVTYDLDFKDLNNVTLYYQGNKIEVMDKAKGIPTGEDLSDYYLEIEPVYAQKIYTGVREFQVDTSGDTISAIADLEGFVTYNKGIKTEDFSYSVEYLNLTGDISDYGTEFFASIKANPSGTFTLTEDIDAKDIALDGNYILNVTFSGKLNGNGYTIRNLKAPLFNTISGGQISDLTIKSSMVTGGKSFIADTVKLNAVIEGVKIYNSTINSSSASSIGAFGGSINSSTVKNCATIACSITGNNTIGGIAGDLQTGGIVENTLVLLSSISGTQSGNSNGTRGAGIAGWLNTTAIIRNCFVDIELNVPGKNGSAGIFGAPVNANAGTVTDCFVKLNTADRYSIGGSDAALGKVSNVYQFAGNATIHTGESLYSVSEYDDNFLKTTIGLSDSMISLINANVALSDTVASLSAMEGYVDEKDTAYTNITKLAPWLDSELVITLGNELTGNLATKEIQSIYPIDGKGAFVTVIDSTNTGEIDKIRILYTDKSHETMQVIANKVMYEIVDTYTIKNINIPYHFNKYIFKDSLRLADMVETIAKDYNYDENISTVYTDKVVRQYRYVYENDIAGNLDVFAKNLVAGEYASASANTILESDLKNKLTAQLPKLLYTYTYYKKSFGFDMCGVNIADLIYFDSEILSQDLDLTTLVDAVGATNRAMSNVYATYERNIAQKTGITLYEQLELFLKLGGISDYDGWLQEYLDCHIVSQDALGYNLTKAEYTAWDNLTNPYRTGSHCNILNLLTIPKEYQSHIAVVSTVGTVLFTDVNIYTSTDPTEETLADFRAKADNMGKLYARYFGTSLNYIPKGEENLYKDVTYQYDTIKCYNNPKYKGVTPTESTAPLIMWICEPIGRVYTGTAGATSWGDWICYGYNTAMTNLGLFSHENAHSQDGTYFLSGNGRRGAYDVEFYTEGFFTEPGSEGIDDIAANRVSKWDIDKEFTAALDYERVDTASEIQDYYKDLFDSGYAFDAMAANSFLAGGVDLQYTVGKYGYFTGDPNSPIEVPIEETAVRKIPYYGYWNREIPLSTYQDIWDYKIVYKGLGGVGSGYERPKFFEINWWQPTNAYGSTDANTFKLMGYEMLGYAGWEEGMIGWASGKYASDEDAIKNITGYDGMEEYKAARYEEAFDNIKTIPYFNNERMEAVITKVFSSQKRNQTPAVDLKALVINCIKRVTDDFTDGTMYEMTEGNKYTVTTAQELIDVINNNSMKEGVYIELANDVDFSGISAVESYYAEHFIGIINGNGHKMKNLSKPLLKSAKFAIFYDIDCEGTSTKYLANTARYALAYDCSYPVSGVLFEAAAGDGDPCNFLLLNNEP